MTQTGATGIDVSAEAWERRQPPDGIAYAIPHLGAFPVADEREAPANDVEPLPARDSHQPAVALAV